MPRIPLRREGATESELVVIEQSAHRGDTGRRLIEYDCRCGDRAHSVGLIAGNCGSGCLVVDNRTVTFHAVRGKDGVSIWLDGRVYKFHVAKSAARQREGAIGAIETQLSAPMPGTILKINAVKGAAFEAHEPLLIMESMKMEVTLSAHHVGSIRDVLCREGELVEMGAVLLRFKPGEST